MENTKSLPTAEEAVTTISATTAMPRWYTYRLNPRFEPSSEVLPRTKSVLQPASGKSLARTMTLPSLYSVVEYVSSLLAVRQEPAVTDEVKLGYHRRLPPSFRAVPRSFDFVVSVPNNKPSEAQNRGCCYYSPYWGRDIARTGERPSRFKLQHCRHYPTSAHSKNLARQATGLWWLRQSEAVRKAKQHSAMMLLLHTRRTQGRWLPGEARGRKALRRKKLSATLCTGSRARLSLTARSRFQVCFLGPKC